MIQKSATTGADDGRWWFQKTNSRALLNKNLQCHYFLLTKCWKACGRSGMRHIKHHQSLFCNKDYDSGWLSGWLACSCSCSSAVFFYDFWGMGNRTSKCMEDDSLLFCYQAQRLGYIIIKDLHSLVMVVCKHIGGLSKNGALVVKNWEEGRTWLLSTTTLHQIVWSFCWENLGNVQIFFPSNLQSCFLAPFFTQILLSLYRIFPLGFPAEAIQRTAIALVLDFSLSPSLLWPRKK